MRGLYAGLTPNLLAQMPNWAIYFTVYESSKHTLSKVFESRLTVDATSAAIAGSCAQIGMNPLWLIKTRFMVSPTKNYIINVVILVDSSSPNWKEM